ncbi:MAG TPA: ABC transporter permease, partial [Planctomycetota bacterium]|nr:ABC transporter permease [Planctomycetota bacterium]
MTAFVVRRLFLLPLLLVAVTFIVFCFARSVPGDPVDVMLGEKGTREAREELTRRWGLDRPLLVQYGIYLTGLMTGDLGRSYIMSKREVSLDLRERFPATIELTFAAMLIAVFAGVSIGVMSAVRKGTWVDTMGMTVSLFGVSIPVFWLGILLILACGGVLPTGGNLDPRLNIERITNFVLIDSLLQGRWDAFVDALRHLLLPALALSTIPMAIVARITRSSMLEVLGQDYVRTARAKGLSEDAVVMRHAFRNALIPIVTIVGTQFGYLLGG